jgi:hypothetical protein
MTRLLIGSSALAEAFARKAYLLRCIADLLAFAGHHGVDRGADLFRNALWRTDIRRRRLVEGGERAFGGHGGVMFSMVTILACSAGPATH